MEGQRNRVTLLIIAGVLFTIYCLVFGDSGIITRLRLAERKGSVETRIARQEFEGARLQEILAKHQRGEQLRDEAYRAGFIEPGSAMLFFGSVVGAEPAARERESSPPAAAVDIVHLRVLWIVVSVIVMMLYVIKNKKAYQAD